MVGCSAAPLPLGTFFAGGLAAFCLTGAVAGVFAASDGFAAGTVGNTAGVAVGALSAGLSLSICRHFNTFF